MATPSKADHESFARARARKEAALATLRELELAEAQEQLVDVGEFLRRVEPWFTSLRATVEGSGLKDEEKRHIMEEAFQNLKRMALGAP